MQILRETNENLSLLWLSDALVRLLTLTKWTGHEVQNGKETYKYTLRSHRRRSQSRPCPRSFKVRRQWSHWTKRLSTKVERRRSWVFEWKRFWCVGVFKATVGLFPRKRKSDQKKSTEGEVRTCWSAPTELVVFSLRWTGLFMFCIGQCDVFMSAGVCSCAWMLRVGEKRSKRRRFYTHQQMCHCAQKLWLCVGRKCIKSRSNSLCFVALCVVNITGFQCYSFPRAQKYHVVR